RVVDQRWVSGRSPLPERESTPACLGLGQCDFEFDNVVFDGTAQSALSVGLTAGADSVSADPTQGTGKLHLILKIDKDLDSVVMGFSGGVVAGLPTMTGSAAVAQTDGGLTVVPSAPGTSPTTVVLDVPLQGLVVGRAITVTGTGQRNQK